VKVKTSAIEQTCLPDLKNQSQKVYTFEITKKRGLWRLSVINDLF